MASIKLFGVLMALVFCAGVVSAGCSSSAYSSACSSCSFDASGKMDSSCYGGIQASAVSCYAQQYPVTYANYSQGKCPGVDDCISELQSCKAQYASGSDKEDCREGSMAVCFSSADVCMSKVAQKCEGIENPCGGSTSFIMLLFGAGAVAAAWKIKG